MVFAINATYSGTNGLNFRGGFVGVAVSGNIVSGSVTAPLSGYQLSNSGLADFTDMAYDASVINVTPLAGSSSLDSADVSYAVTFDINGLTRGSPADVGAIDVP